MESGLSKEHQQVIDDLNDTAQKVGELVTVIRKNLNLLDPESQKNMEGLLSEIEEAATEILDLREEVPNLELNTEIEK